MCVCMCVCVCVCVCMRVCVCLRLFDGMCVVCGVRACVCVCIWHPFLETTALGEAAVQRGEIVLGEGECCVRLHLPHLLREIAIHKEMKRETNKSDRDSVQ